MKYEKYNIKFPLTKPHKLNQNEAYFYFRHLDQEYKVLFHDYDQIFKFPGLYEQLYYERLKCCSPEKVESVLSRTLQNNQVEMTELRVLDLGAGNGMFGERLYKKGVARIVGVDISTEAQKACERDRPGIYDDYLVTDLCTPNDEMTQKLTEWQFDCLSCVAALGFGDIPAKAFANAFNLIKPSAWIAFNIKETFLLETDNSGFSNLIKSLLFSETLSIHHLERYRHRISIDGRSLFYYTFVGKKENNISKSILDKI